MKENRQELINTFNKISFFNDFSRQEKEEIASLTSLVISYNPREYILNQGDLDAFIFILLKGEVKITKKENPEKTIATLKPGSVFGEIAFLNQTPRITNVVCTKPTFVLKLNGKMIEELSPTLKKKISGNLTKILAQRLDAANKIISRPNKSV